ncbi:serine O-acetyltransferase [Parabacteroides sp. OttesenSCG-928-G06]|nr:serine O-acetyltransferase [Parabacteroides sp. OttesenSCG-928-G06]
MKKILEYILSDYQRYTSKDVRKDRYVYLKIILLALSARNHCFAYSFWLRLASQRNIFYPIALFMHVRLSRKYGVQIPRKTKIGYGLYIGHGIGIVINYKTVIGNNCNISQFLTIGSNKETPATIGDNVYIGPACCLVEDVCIGDNVSIGAGAVVTKDIPANATAAGVPAKVISYKEPGRFILNRWTLRE